jgi:hypothetical protein
MEASFAPLGGTIKAPVVARMAFQSSPIFAAGN